MEMLKPYRHSGEFNPAGPLLALAIATAAGFPLAYAYALFCHFVPLIYVDVFATAGYGLLIGLAGTYALKQGNVRNMRVAAGTGVIIGIIALYWAWSAHLRMNVQNSPLYSDFDLLRKYMAYLFDNGSWSIRGLEIKGFTLAVVWAAEALIILVISTAISVTAVQSTPYCERTGVWLNEEKKFEQFAPISDANDVEALKKGDFSPLRRIQSRAPGTYAFTRVTLRYSSQPGSMRTISVDTVALSEGKDGSTIEDIETLLPISELPPSLYEVINGFERLKLKPATIAAAPKAALQFAH